VKSKIDPGQDSPKIEKTSETTWIIELEEDPETGDVVMPLPEELIQSQGWAIGDTLEWDVNEETGEIVLKKSTDQ
jgi:hypothetical protein